MKDQVLEILNCSCDETEKFNKLFEVYKTLPGKSHSMERRFNGNGYSKKAYESLVYETKKLVGATDLEVATFEGGCGGCGKAAKEVDLNPGSAMDRNKLIARYEELYGKKPAANAKNATIKSKIDEKEAELSVNKEDETSDNPQDENQNAEDSSDEPKYREEYTFLNNPDLPDEFKILANDKITAHKIVQDGRVIILAASEGNSDLSEEELAELGKKVTEADELNDLIHEEFTHYETTGEILGKHPIFKEHNLKKEISLMTADDKVARIKALDTGIRRDKKSLKDAKSDKKKAEAQSRLDEKELELKLIKLSM